MASNKIEEDDDEMEQYDEFMLTDVELQKLQEKVDSNPFDYNARIDLIKALRGSGELERLQTARESMTQSFPLTPTLWLEWIKDQMNTAGDDSKTIRSLFDRAVKDYVSVDLWLEYVQWACGAEGGPEAAREVFERALTAVGLHCNKGILLWDAYREFETILLSAYQPAPGAIISPAQQTESANQRARLDKLFRRQLALPLNGLRDVWDEYIEFLEGEAPDKLATDAYHSATKKLETLLPLEDALEKAGPRNLAQFQNYIDFEQKHRDPARIQSIFERAVASHCLNALLWMKYVTWLDKYLKIHEVILPVYERAVRNCSWSADLWQRYVLAVERAGKPFHDVQDVFERSLDGGFNTVTECIQLYVNYVFAVRRNVFKERSRSEVERTVSERESGSAADINCKMDYVSNGKKDVSDLDNDSNEATDSKLKNVSNMEHISKDENVFNERTSGSEVVNKCFQEGRKFLIETFGEAAWDPECSYRKTYAYFLASSRRDIDAAREVWQTIISDGNGPFAGSWMEFFQLERQFAEPTDRHHRCQKLLYQAVNSVVDYPDTVCHALLQFEREEGELADLDVAMQKVESRLAQIVQRQAHQKNRQSRDRPHAVDRIHKADQSRHRTTSFDQSKSRDRGKVTPPADQSQSRDRKRSAVADSQSSSSAKMVDQSQPDKPKDSEGFAVPFAPPPAKKPKSTNESPSTGNSANESSSLEKQTNHRPSAADATPPVASGAIDTSKYDRTVFVSNLSYKCGKTEVEEVFKNVGEVVEVRIVPKKGYGFVEFSTADVLPAALEQDRYKIDGRPMFVSRAEDKSKNPTKFRFATGLEKKKLFVKGIHPLVTEEELYTLFEQQGKLKEARLVLNRSGTSKGIAYVEFEEEEDASKALVQLDGKSVRGKPLSVALSNPPVRGAPLQAGRKVAPSALGGGAGKAVAAGGKETTRLPHSSKLQLTPRALKPAVASQKSSQAGARKDPVHSHPAVAKNTSTASMEVGKEVNTEMNVHGAAEKAKLSNQQFRNMFLKKE